MPCRMVEVAENQVELQPHQLAKEKPSERSPSVARQCRLKPKVLLTTLSRSDWQMADTVS